ncbi:WW domain-containing adapter protein with coiled-coil-like [Notothenia coriiceps]|uniref:WW domain-containing adapter protein with coiled-coil-like n=1 Tax=Notothenia coriiceps TaxID=8208 RepID=A0A6I9MXR9_9TELE|nr:PREDICTED: WW domain-containing adapter protein with coiled-coil-like [Notothenia coriiceps]
MEWSVSGVCRLLSSVMSGTESHTDREEDYRFLHSMLMEKKLHLLFKIHERLKRFEKRSPIPIQEHAASLASELAEELINQGWTDEIKELVGLFSQPDFKVKSISFYDDDDVFLNERAFPPSAQHSSQSPVSLTSDASSPRPYVSPRNGTPQSSQKPPLGMHPGGVTSSQTRGSMSSAKQGPVPVPQTAEKRPEDPRIIQQRSSQELLCSGSNAHGAALPHAPPGSSSSQTQPDNPGTFTPSLATHFDESLIRHIQGWPSENTEKQAARLREDIHNMGSLYMSEICTEMKNLRSLVRVCEIQATLREQRILFLRQQSKELDKLKNQNSYMV